jgi:hypothetical protein
MQWKQFKDELPEEGRMILFGNYRIVESSQYQLINFNLKIRKMAYKPITHWIYIELPPFISEEFPWKTT